MYKKLIFSTLLLSILSISNVILGMESKQIIEVSEFAVGIWKNKQMIWKNAQNGNEINLELKQQLEKDKPEMGKIAIIDSDKNTMEIPTVGTIYKFSLLDSPTLNQLITEYTDNKADNKAGINFNIATLNSNYEGGGFESNTPSQKIFSVTQIIKSLPDISTKTSSKNHKEESFWGFSPRSIKILIGTLGIASLGAILCGLYIYLKK